MTKPDRLRLVRSPHGRGNAPRAPFGLGGFVADEADEAAALAIEVDREDTIEALLTRIPGAETLPAGTMVVVLGGVSKGGLVAKLFGQSQPLARAVRASALLARGFRAIEACVDNDSGDDLVVGLA